MSSIFADFHHAQHVGSGHVLANCLALVDTEQDPRRLESFSQFSNYQTITADVRYHILQDRAIQVKLPKSEGNAWVEIFVSLWTCVREVVSIDHGIPNAKWSKAFDAYKDVCMNLIRGYSTHGFQAWTVPCLYATGKYLRMIAIKADTEINSMDGSGVGDGFLDNPIGTDEKSKKLEQAAYVINRMFSTCLSDRSELSESRKWGIYSATNLLFKTYFKLNSISLCKNVLRALAASEAEIPPLHLFPKPQRVTYKYYRGLIAFLEENYGEAEEHLTEALDLCHRTSRKNREQILTYLIPCHLLTTHTLPSKTLLEPYPTLSTLLTPLYDAIRTGSLAQFDTALAAGEAEFVRRRIYLTLERGRDIALRNLFRKVFLAAGFEESKNEAGEVVKVRRTRVSVAEFEAGMRVGVKGGDGETTTVDRDEVECFLANLIYKNLMKGYIARERGIVVLSKNGAFPGTGV